MSGNLQNMLYAFVANVIDCCDDTIIQSFINSTNNTVHVDTLLSNPLTKTSIIFQIVWNTLFKSTYPTKKDFAELVAILGGYQTIMKPTYSVNPRAILQACVNHEAFTVLKITGNLVQGLQKIEKQIPQLTNANIHEFLVTRWTNRFCAKTTPEPNNIVRIFVHLQNAYQPTVLHGHDNFKPMVNTFTANELKWLNENEKVQYVLYRNNRLLLQMIAHCVIICHKTLPPKYILHVIQQDIKQHVSVIHVDSPNKIKLGMKDHSLSKGVYDMLPCIIQNVICINTPTEWQYPCTDSPNCNGIYLNLDEPCAYLSGEKIPKVFKFCLTNMHQYTDPLCHVYALPCGGTDFNKHIMKWYLSLHCPFRSANVKDNTILYAHFLSYYIHSIKKDVMQLAKDELHNCVNSENVILAVDTRYNILTLYAVLSSYARLHDKQNWKMCIATNKAAIPHYKKALHKILGVDNTIDVFDVSIINHDSHNMFHMELYNAILKDETFWGVLQEKGFKRCLIVQDDGLLIKDNGKLESFLAYDYVGAPWVDAADNEYIKQYVNPDMVGNGGFSLRSVGMMVKVCREFKDEKKHLFYHNINEIPEDVYFVQCLKKLDTFMPSNVVAKEFAIEQVYDQYVTPLGFHKFWLYHSAAISWRIFQGFLE